MYMKRLAVLLTVVFIVPFFSSCGEQAEGKIAVPSVGPDYSNRAIENFDGEYEEANDMQHPVAFITMESGAVIKAELYPEIAPNTVNNFISLINKGFYDGVVFHRIIPGFMIQGGDPEGTGMGGPGYSIKGEFSHNGFKNDLLHTKGVLSMARTMVPDSAGSQFFIMHANAPHLDGDYAAFGKLTEGEDVLDKIATCDTDWNDRPLQPQVMKTVTVETFDVDYDEPEIL